VHDDRRMKAWPFLMFVTACVVGDEPQRFVIEGEDVVVQPDALSVPIATHGELAEATAGDLVAGVQSGGYVRRIVDVGRTSDHFELATVDIPLSEAVPDGATPNTKAAGGQQQLSLGFALDNHILYKDSQITVELAHGSLAFTPTLDFDLSISGAQLDHFLTATTGQLDGEVSINVTAPAGGTWNVAKTVWSNKSTHVQMVGWVPVVEVIELKAGVGVDIGAEGAVDLQASGKLSSSVRAGVEYEGGGWHGIGNADMAREASLVDHASAPATIALQPYVFAEIYVKMYGVAGPYVKARSGLRLSRTLQSAQWDKAVTLTVDGGALLDIPFGDTLRYDARVLDNKWAF
jgi:hypothetical protein